jgi:hypothetical protein
MVQLAPRFAALLAFCFLTSATPVLPAASPYLSLSAGVVQPTPGPDGTHANHTARAVAVLVANNTAITVKPTPSPHRNETHANNTSRAVAVANKHPVYVIEQHPGSQSHKQAQGQDPVCCPNLIEPVILLN